MVCMVGYLCMKETPISIFKEEHFQDLRNEYMIIICVYSIKMRSYKRSRRSRSARRGRSGGADDMNINVPNDMEIQNAAPVNPF